jgi:hypothetical protein
MKTFSLLCLFFCTFYLGTAHSQHFIGKGIDEIKQQMRAEKNDFFFAKEVNTGKYHFLKFENVEETKTMLFLLDENGKCEYTKLMCDYSLLKNIEDSLNQNYEYQKDMTWIDYTRDSTQNYLIELEKKEWFFTVKTSPIKK